MGVLNVTEDSFSDGGAFLQLDEAVEHGVLMAAEGAEIIDVGGESTRPGAEPVSVEVELARVVPVIRALRERLDVAISIDTSKVEVARAALNAGATIINDVTGLMDPAMIELAQVSGAGVVIMHMQGEPRTMQREPHYEDVVGEVRNFFRQRYAACLACGMNPRQIAFDPGIGFGKTLEHNLALLRGLPELGISRRPLLLGVSRKSFIGRLLGEERMGARDWPTVALTAFLREQGARIFRVHEVKQNLEALRMVEAIAG